MQEKKIIIASDHAGCPLKQELIPFLKTKGYAVLDCGPEDASTPVDYPDKAYLLAKGLYQQDATQGILICGSGIGMSMAVNRYAFIRGALVDSAEGARLARCHNDANVLILGGRLISVDTAKACVETFLTTAFEGGRHVSRLEKLENMNHDFEH